MILQRAFRLLIPTLLILSSAWQPVIAETEITLLNVSYDPTRELYQEVNELFAKHWQEKTGETLIIQQSHGGSGKQARAVRATALKLETKHKFSAVGITPTCFAAFFCEAYWCSISVKKSHT